MRIGMTNHEDKSIQEKQWNVFSSFHHFSSVKLVAVQTIVIIRLPTIIWNKAGIHCFIFFRQITSLPLPIHWVLDRNFRKFWLNVSRPWCYWKPPSGDGYFLIRLLGMCRWMGSHFHDWIDYNGRRIFNGVTRMVSHIFGFYGARRFFIFTDSKRTRTFVL